MEKEKQKASDTSVATPYLTPTEIASRETVFVERAVGMKNPAAEGKYAYIYVPLFTSETQYIFFSFTKT